MRCNGRGVIKFATALAVAKWYQNLQLQGELQSGKAVANLLGFRFQILLATPALETA